MPRYFFDAYEGTKLIRDTEGVELPSLEAAKQQAHASLSDMLRDAGYVERGTDFRVSVRNNGGVRVIVSLQTRVFEREPPTPPA